MNTLQPSGIIHPSSHIGSVRELGPDAGILTPETWVSAELTSFLQLHHSTGQLVHKFTLGNKLCFCILFQH